MVLIEAWDGVWDGVGDGDREDGDREGDFTLTVPLDLMVGYLDGNLLVLELPFIGRFQ